MYTAFTKLSVVHNLIENIDYLMNIKYYVSKFTNLVIKIIQS